MSEMRWSEGFQRRVLRRALDTGVVTPALFSATGATSPRSRIAADIAEWWGRYPNAPMPADILRERMTRTAGRLGPEERDAVLREVEDVLGAPVDDAPEYIDDEARRWSQFRAAELAVIEAADIISSDGADGMPRLAEIFRSLAAPPRAGGVEVLSAEDILSATAEPVDWLVDGLLPAVGTSNLLAKPKVGKSALARQLAMAVGATGAEWLGRRVKRGVVLYLALEGLTATRYHFSTMGLRPGDDVNVVRDKRVTVADLEELVGSRKPALAVVDTIFRLVRVKDGNSYAEVTTGYDDLIRIAGDYGCHVMAIHHAPKVERGVADASLGSTAIAGAVDTQILIKRLRDDPTSERVVASEQRDGAYIPWTTLSWDPATQTSALGASVVAASSAAVQAAILERVLRGGVMTRGEIVGDKSIPGTTKEKDAALLLMSAAKRTLVKTRDGKRDKYHVSEQGITSGRGGEP